MRFGAVGGESYLAHRVIWKMLKGYDPDVIDHINEVKTDNRIENLRDVSQRKNLQAYRRKRPSREAV